MQHKAAMPEMLHSDMSVWERQRARLKWQQQQQSYLNENSPINHPFSLNQAQHLLPTTSLPSRQCPDLACLSGDGLPDFAHYPIPGTACLNPLSGLSRISSCSPDVEEAQSEKGKAVIRDAGDLAGKGIGSCFLGNESSRSSSKKRIADREQSLKQQEANTGAMDSNNTKSKRIKGDDDIHIMEPKRENQPNNNLNNNDNKRETSGNTSKENSKLSDGHKTDYIHVRARRGQATDSHSLAERVRREKISERMKYLQDLVPGCNKITGKAGMLDEIINYVQSLQRQVEFLSMKLATVNPRIDYNMDNFLDKEIISVCGGTASALGIYSELSDQTFIPYQQLVACSGLDLTMNSPEMALHRTTSAPVSVPEAFAESCFNVHQSPVWDTELHSSYNGEFERGRASTFPFQSLPGTIEDNDFRTET